MGTQKTPLQTLPVWLLYPPAKVLQNTAKFLVINSFNKSPGVPDMREPAIDVLHVVVVILGDLFGKRLSQIPIDS